MANDADCNDGADHIHPGAEEFCDGLDFDCDGEDANGLVGPPCVLQVGVCGGATKICGGAQGWLPCGPEAYGPHFEAVEVSCDGLDNDCDGAEDESVNCDDANPCTADYCAGALGCVHDPGPAAGSPCDDGNPCTSNDTCDGMGNCIGTPIICDDGNPCTDDYCDSLVGCVYIPNHGVCDDGDPCTVNDVCDGTGACYGTPIDCDDGISCTVDECDGYAGCIHTPLPGWCVINGICYSDGQQNPASECQECNTMVSSTSWTNLVNGTICGDGYVCMDGVCVPE